MTAERGDLAQHRAAQVRVRFLRHQKYRLDLGVQVQVHQRHGELVLHVARGAQAAEHDAGPDLADEGNSEAAEGPHDQRSRKPDGRLSRIGEGGGCRRAR